MTFNTASSSHTYALFNAFTLCSPSRIELEFTTSSERGLFFFNGAIDREARYFISAQYVDKTIIVNVGASNNLTINNVVLSDRRWHKLDISISENVIKRQKKKKENCF